MQETEQNNVNLTPQDIKDALQELLKYGLLESERKPNLYRTTLTWRDEINAHLEALDFVVNVDETRGLVFLVSATEDVGATTHDVEEDIERTHPLVRRQRLNMEQSLLLAVLRQYFLAFEQENGVGSGNARVAIDELVGALYSYLPESGSASQDERRVRNLLEQLQKHSIVTEIDDNDRVGIRPIITHVATPASLTALLDHYREQARLDPS